MSYLRDVSPSFMGFALVISLSTMLGLRQGAWGVPAGAEGLAWLSNAVRVVTFLSAALLSDHIHALSSHRLVLASSSGLATLGVGLVMVCAQAGSLPLYVLGLALSSLGYATLYLYWIELYARMDLMHVVAGFSLVHLLSAALSLALLSVPAPALVCVCLLAMPLASAALYARSLKAAEGAPFMQGERPQTGWSVPWRPMVLLGTFTFANSFVRHFLTNELKGAVLAGVVAGAAVVLALLAWRRERLDLRVLYGLSLPAIVAASLCVLVALPGVATAGAMLSNAAYAFVSVYTTALLCSVSYRYGVGALWLFGFALASTSMGSLASSVLVARVDFVAADPLLLTLTVSAVIMVFVCLYVAFGGTGESARAWGIMRTPARDSAPVDEGDVERACARVARRCGLTRREEEVMALLAQDVPYAQIEERLVIANSTLKTHVRHIYAKVGVSDRHALVELVARERDGHGRARDFS